jgi:ABC-type Fe3+/spermidine/putrescine transport system ATPase subunit
MSDRIAVMSNARIAQLGTPAETYECPRTEFVARFIGESNFFQGVPTGRMASGWGVATENGPTFVVPDHPTIVQGKRLQIAVRPEWLDVCRRDDVPADENVLHGTVREVIYLGETLHVLVEFRGGGTAAVALRNEGQLTRPLSWKAGDEVAVAWKPEDCQVLEPD